MFVVAGFVLLGITETLEPRRVSPVKLIEHLARNFSSAILIGFQAMPLHEIIVDLDDVHQALVNGLNSPSTARCFFGVV